MADVYRKNRDRKGRKRAPINKEQWNEYQRRRRAEQNKADGVRHWHPYTDEESVLIGLWSLDGVPTKEQAERLGRTPKAIMQVRWKWGLEAPMRRQGDKEMDLVPPRAAGEAK